MTGTIIAGVIAALLAWLIWSGIQEGRRRRAAIALIRQITGEALCCLYSHGRRFQTIEINGQRSRWLPFVVSVTPAQVAIYGLKRGGQALSPFTLLPDQLRWFGRPQKYVYGRNEIWLHGEMDHRWVLIRLWLWQDDMQALVRALKVFATPEQVIAYRRRRPYSHYGPVTAQPATQDMLGAWTLDDPVSLYLMPTALVVLDGLDGVTIQQTIALNTIQGVSAVRRADQRRMAGLVRFEAGGQPFAFALEPYEALAAALAEAARHTLEDPVEWLGRKKKKGDDLDIDEGFS